MDAFDIAEQLAAHGQEHVLTDIESLSAEQRDAFIARLAKVDWEELQCPVEVADSSTDADTTVGPSRVIQLTERTERADEFIAAGEVAYAAGQVAVLMVAGGQGSRLGFSGPKGCYEIGAHSGKSIYQVQAEKVLALSQRVQKAVPFAVMTSPATDSETREYFAVNDNFGLAADQVLFFSQSMVPSIDENGKALLAGPGQLLENPDGHGGCHTALVASGTLDELEARGIQQIVYIQVDNILVPVDDPELVGVAVVENTDVITKVLEKADPDERVGHLVKIAGRDHIIEYTELTEEETRLTYDDGSLIYRWGSPAMHCWSVGFFRRLADKQFTLPLHRSQKPLKAWTAAGITEVIGWKNERFIFDLVSEAEQSVGLVIDRDDEFAPVKNPTGIDSAQSAQQLASDLYGRWLASTGVTVELQAGQHIEISPLFAATKKQFQHKWDNRLTTVCGDYYLE